MTDIEIAKIAWKKIKEAIDDVNLVSSASGQDLFVELPDYVKVNGKKFWAYQLD